VEITRGIPRELTKGESKDETCAHRDRPCVIHQQLQLVSELAAAENLRLGRFPNKSGAIDFGDVDAKLNHWPTGESKRRGLLLKPNTQSFCKFFQKLQAIKHGLRFI
jgi:ABC-type uncharacterized transport system ATPase subunit